MRRTLAVLGLVASVGCTCGPEVSVSDGIAVLDPVSASGLNFGRVRVSESRRLAITILNNGIAPLAITAVERDGLPPTILSTQPPPEIKAGDNARVEVTFSPEEVGPASGSLVFLTDSSTTPRLVVNLSGEGVRTNVTASPQDLDFGLREVLTREVRTITLKNEGLIAEDIAIIAFPDSNDSFSLGQIPGENNVIRLEAGAEAEVPVVFEPKRPGPSFASTIDFIACESCDPITVTVRGAGIEAYLDVNPKDCLDFGLVNPGSSLERAVTVANLGSRGLNILEASITTGGENFVLGSFTAQIGAEQVIEIPVTYGPRALTADRGTLRLLTDDPKAQEVNVCLQGSGGGPDISAQPNVIDFGRVAVGVTRTRTVTINNAGLSSGASSQLTITGVSFQNSNVEFNSSAVTPITIDVGRSARIDVTYTPGDDGADSEVLLVATNDTDTPVLTVPLTGRGLALPPCLLEVVPGGLAFGNVERARTSTLPLALRNGGESDCLVDSLNLAPGTDSVFSLPTGAIDEQVLAAGEILSIQVAFRPTNPGSYRGQIGFNVSDPANPTRTVDLSGVSVTGCLLISPNEIDFGTVGANCASRDREIVLYNTCTTAVRLQALSLSADPGAPFVIFNTPVTFPITVDAVNGVKFRAKYSPKELGQHQGAIFVKTDERPEPYNLPVVGQATADAVQHDSYYQEDRPSVDLLFVIDNSGSMSSYQQNIATNFSAFMKYAIQQQVDYRIAATTTDVFTSTGEGQGYFIPRSGRVAGRTVPRVLTPNTPNVESEFATIVNVGTNGSADERGLEAAYMALTSPRITTPISAGGNGGFLRDDALFSIIIVSDEPDSSKDSVPFYLNFFRNIKGARRANLFSLSSIVDLQYGERYISVANQTNGVVSNINTQNWAGDLERLGAIAFGYKTRFFLTSTPVAGTMEVRIDGDLVPAREPNSTITNWRYDSVANAIEFSTVSLPEPGSTLEISYTVACGT